MILKKWVNSLRCMLGSHPAKDAPVIELWQGLAGGQVVVFKCARCNSTVGSMCHESR